MRHYDGDGVTLLHGDCIDVMRQLPDNSVDAVVTDPPYGLEFMGKEWDAPWKAGKVEWADEGTDKSHPFRDGSARIEYGIGGTASLGFQLWFNQVATEALRVLKPGGHLLAFGGTRTWHRLAVAIEDAGFEVRDSVAWVYGSGFPKSLDVSKAIDKKRDGRHFEALAVTVPMFYAMKAKGLTRRDLNCAVGREPNDAGSAQSWTTVIADGAHKPRVPTLDQWAVLRSLLDLQHLDDEVWRLNGRKGQPGEAWAEREVIGKGFRVDKKTSAVPISGATPHGHYDITGPATPAAEQWQGWGTALKPAHEPIVVARKPLIGTVAENVLRWGTGALNIDGCRIAGDVPQVTQGLSSTPSSWEHRKEPRLSQPHTAGRWPANVILDESQAAELDKQSGVTKSPPTYTRSVKGEGSLYRIGEPAGAESLNYGDSGGASRFFYVAKAGKKERPNVDGIAHPTVKPLALMRYLVRLVTPPGGTVLEPFAGSGATVEACIEEGFNVIAIERETDYLPLIMQRIQRATNDKQARLI